MELEIIRWLQSWHSPLLDQLMLWITMLGSEDFYLLFGPIFFWCLGPAIGMRLIALLASSFYVNDWLKHAFDTLRPAVAYPQQVRAPDGALDTALAEDGALSGAFPSGHAQVSLTFWGFVALLARRPLFLVVAAAVVLLVSLSRVYLGVHWPADVLGGWLVALLLLAGMALIAPRLARMRLDLCEQLLLGSAAATLLLALLDGSPDRAKVLGLWSGAAAAYVAQQRYVAFPVQVRLWQQVAKVALGLLGLFALRLALKDALPLDAWAGWLRYALLGVWVVLLAPLIFRRLFGRPASPLGGDEQGVHAGAVGEYRRGGSESL